jgi:hypothetical protein
MSTDAEALATALHAQRLLGRTPARAMATLAALPRSLTGLNQQQLSAAALGAMLSNVYAGKISPVDTAEILCDMGYALTDVAMALRQACPELTALETGSILIDQKILPCTSRLELVGALERAGHDAASSTLAATILFPVTVTVQARDGWQATGVIVDARYMTTIACRGGNWTIDGEPGGCDGAGYAARIAGPACPLPGVPEGALVGRAGATNFLVGHVTTVPAGLHGALELCINTEADGGHGGRLLVRVSTKIPARTAT